MEFGKTSDISHVNFSLPPDHFQTRFALARNTNSPDSFRFFFGTTRWGEKELTGKIYPPKTSAKDYLYYYSRQFSSVEMNTTYYRIPTESVIQQWRKKTPTVFKFCPKVPQIISHSHDFGESLKATSQFLTSLKAFGPQLGIPFMQLPPDFSPWQGRRLFDYLADWPQDIPLAIEFRHPEWFHHERIKNRAFDRLETLGISPVITDTAGRRDVIHQRLTNSKVLIRFVGNSLHASDYERIREWVARIKTWISAGLEEIYFFVHQPEESLAVDLAIYLIQQINQACGLSLNPPKILSIGEQQSLF